MERQGVCHELSTTDPEVPGAPAGDTVLILLSSQQTRLGLRDSFWAKTASFLLWQGSWKLLELVRYHIIPNTEVSVAALLTWSVRAFSNPLPL